MTRGGVEDRLGERILVLAPLGRDADLTVAMLEEAGLSAQVCADMGALVAGIQKGAGLALVTSESLTPSAISEISSALRRQPNWSDIPVLVFTPPGWNETTSGADMLDRLRALGNLSLLERPIRVATLLSAVEAALRARRRQYEIRDLLAQLHEGMHQRDRFLAMLGHELRNPLNALLIALQNLGWAEAHPSEPNVELTAQQEGIIARQTRILSRLVDDLLEVSRVTTGKVTLRRNGLDLAGLAQSVADSFRSPAQERGVELRLRAQEWSPVWVEGDETRLGQVLSNLLANAVKYTPAGGSVEVVVEREGRQAVLAVRDTGVGIEPDVLPRIFDLFRQGDRTLDRAGGGLGIGLTLVRSLVELHGGTIEAQSGGLGQGSEFLVRLPAAAAPAPAVEPEALPAAAAPAAPHVFVLEDHEDNREGLVHLLRRLGHQVEAEEDGARGAQRIIEARPDVALIDIGLPSLDGYEVARRVRAALGSGIVLVALTGYGQREDRDASLQAGFDAHLPKPIDFAQLRRLLTIRERGAATLS
jgi:signal transduction histidine kinase/CheY-like chemotaxis protein